MSNSKRSAVEETANSLKSGLPVAHTPAAPKAGGDEADLFAGELEPFEAGAIRPPKRRVGRPPGSPNRTTLQLQRLLLARGYRDPAEFLAAIVTNDARQLAADLAGKPLELVTFAEALEVAKLQRQAADGLMPYFHQKMPTAVEVKGDAPRQLIVMGDVVNMKAVADQRLSAIDAEASHGDQSHEED
jgi:hypothetical protein